MNSDREYLDLMAHRESGVVSNDDVLLIGDASMQTALKVKVGLLLAGATITPAAHVDPPTATPQQIAEALIAAGLMEDA